MSLERAKTYLKKWNLEDKVLEFDISTATVALAAKAAGTKEERIAKSISFDLGQKVILIVTAGDAKIDNRKFKDQFSTKARMLPLERVEEETGYDVGGVCPFGVKEGISIYLDISLQRFPTVFPACGTANSAVEVTPQELEKITPGSQWIDVCKGWEA